jgi:hypothetical protein
VDSTTTVWGQQKIADQEKTENPNSTEREFDGPVRPKRLNERKSNPKDAGIHPENGQRGKG